MAIIVQKFGGTSVADATKIRRAAKRAVTMHQRGHQVVMVVSARGKKTDELVRLAAEITDDPTPREMDMLLSTGEQESVALMAMAVQELGVEAISLTGGQIGVLTDSSHTKARIRSIKTERIRNALDSGKIVVAAGFQGVDQDLNITTLGRGGSDTTATALAAVMEAEECQIYTDVEGVFTTDPRMVPEARKLPRISYEEMLELASVGAGVMHSRSIEFAKKYDVPVRVGPSYEEGEGTLITHHSDENARMVSGVAVVDSEVRVSLRGLPDRPGVLAAIFTKMSEHKIPIDMVVQDISTDGIAEVTFTVPESELAETLTAAAKAIDDLGAGEVETGTDVAKVSAVGSGMRYHPGVAAQLFTNLAELGTNIAMVTTSEIKVSVLVQRDRALECVRKIHGGFELDRDSTPPDAQTASRIEPLKQEVDSASESRAELEREIVSRLASMEDIVVSQVSLDTDQARVSVSGLPDQSGTLAPIFAAVAGGGIMVDMIVQNVSHSGQANLSFTVPKETVDDCLAIVEKILELFPEAKLTHDRDIAILNVQGIGLRSHTGVGEAMFRTLAETGVNVQLVNTSETRLSVVIDPEAAPKAFEAVQNTFPS